MAAEYAFVDEWDVDAPIEEVFDALADARTYPTWWGTVFKEVDVSGPPAVGVVSTQHTKARLPYHMRFSGTITRLEPPNVLEYDVVGDFTGHGRWTLTDTGGNVHVRLDFRIHVGNHPVLRRLTPVFRPLFGWNHRWAMARAMEGLEPYLRSRAAR